ncbi:MAG: uracil-DNA glycosylase [Candidatus Omnitrophica bacterium]|nr:uracil-DNA glycosylase [Candidatus Omnitrophota bacterium]
MTGNDRIIRVFRDAVESEMLSGVSEIYGQARKAGHGGRQGKDPEEGVKRLEKSVKACVKCGLAATRKNVVFGEGSYGADLMFVGEAPGGDEDEQGRPFVGRAGKLLTKIIEALGLEREDVFIANILKCRPPGNRNPAPGEIDLCTPYLLRQIELIKPRVIVALGKFAAQTLLQSDTPISRLRGNFHDYHGVKLMPTYHPAYLLRNPGGKKDVWNDMKAVAKELGIRIPEQKKK